MPIRAITAIILIPALLIVVEHFLAKLKNPVAGLILPITLGISFVITTWYGILLSIFLFIVYLVTRHNIKAKENKAPTDLDKMNIEDLS